MPDEPLRVGDDHVPELVHSGKVEHDVVPVKEAQNVVGVARTREVAYL